MGDISYAQYVLQFAAMTLWCAPTFATPAFFVFLAAMSYVAVMLVSKPGRAAWMRVGAPVGPG